MSYNFNEHEVKQQFFELMNQTGIIPYEQLDIQLDGQIHRFRTQEDKSGDKSGAYCVSVEDWPHGFVQDWRLSNEHIDFSFNRGRLDEEGKNYFTDPKYQEAIERSRKHQDELRKKQEAGRAKSLTIAIDIYNQLPNAQNDFPYLVNKGIILPECEGENYSEIKYDKSDNQICIPLKDIDGNIHCLQWIDENGGKKFHYQTSPSGAFYSLDLSSLKYDSEKKTPILIGEGIATMLTIYNLFGGEYPIVAAMNCGNLYPVAQAIKEKYKGWNIFIMADNDHLRNDGNIGLIKAEEANKKLNLNGVIYPFFTRKQSGTDWNDFYATHGKDITREKISREIALYLMPKEKREVMQKVREINAFDLINKEIPPLKWAVRRI